MRQLGIFAKYWQPGTVKTRLAATIGAARASRIYRAFLDVLLRRLEGLADRYVLAVTPADRRAEFVSLAAGIWNIEPQSPGDLGARIEHYFHRALAAGASRAVLLGSDSPTLPMEHVQQAWRALAQYRVVLGPARDGGYYLVGIRGRVPPMFDNMAWGTSSVWEETTHRLRRAGIPYAVLPEWYDVDTGDDLRRLGEELLCSDTDDRAWRRLRALTQEALGDLR